MEKLEIEIRDLRQELRKERKRCDDMVQRLLNEIDKSDSLLREITKLHVECISLESHADKVSLLLRELPRRGYVISRIRKMDYEGSAMLVSFTDPLSRPDKQENANNMSELDEVMCCSFCGKQRDEVRRLVANSGNPLVAICDQCILLCIDILISEVASAVETAPEEEAAEA